MWLWKKLMRTKVDIDLRDERVYYLNPKVGSIHQRQKCFSLLFFTIGQIRGKGGRGD